MNFGKVRIITFWDRFFKYLLLGLSGVILVILVFYVYPSGISLDVVQAYGTNENIKVVYPTPTPQVVVNQAPPTVISNPAANSYSSSSATGGGGGSANVTVTQTQTTGKKTVVPVKELPRTGLPLLAWGAVVLVPIGLKLRKFLFISIKPQNDKPVFISHKRIFNKHP